MAKTTILLLGATGLIGGTILAQLLEQPNSDSFTITALVRSAEKAEKLKTFGVNAVVGATEDSALLEKLALEADVVILATPAENPLALNTILPALKKRFAATGIPPRYISVGGTSLLGDGALGMHGPEKTYTDMDPSLFLDPPRPEMKPFGFLAQTLVKADEEGYVKTYMISPPFVYGTPATKFVDAGIQNARHSMWSLFIKPAFSRGKGGYVGEGKNVYGCVEVNDLASLFVLVLQSGETAPHGKEGTYLAHVADFYWKDLAQAIGDGLVKLGKADSNTPASYTQEELDQYFPPIIPFVLGSNVKAISEKSYSIGWKPRHGVEEFLQNVRDETEKIGKEL